MDKNNVFWVIIGVLIVAALGVIFYYWFLAPPAPIGVSIKINPLQTVLYPYQLIYATANITNTGKTYIHGLNFGVFFNGSLVNIYNISLPVGMHTEINFSHEAISQGEYNLSVIADPTGGDNLENRSTSHATVGFYVLKRSNATAFSILSNNNSFESLKTISGGAYVPLTYLNQNYGLSIFRMSDVPAINAFLTPILNLTYSYINKMYSAEAIYKTSTVYSLWIAGPLTQNVFAQGARGANLSVSNKTLNNESVIFINIDKNTTLCSWYAGGWTKVVGVMGSPNCYLFMNNSKYNNTLNNAAKLNILKPIGENDTIANITTLSKIGNGYGKLFFVNSSFVFESIEPNLVGSSVCYGLINVVNNVSYCSSYDFGKTSEIGPVSLFDTKAYVGQYNLSILNLINTSLVTAQIPKNIGVLENIKINGTSIQFSNGISNSCVFNASVVCSSPVFGLNGITINLHNNLNSTFLVRTMACYQSGIPIYEGINQSIPALSNKSFSAPCYENGNVINGVSLGLYLNMIMNYSVGRANYTSVGHAYLV